MDGIFNYQKYERCLNAGRNKINWECAIFQGLSVVHFLIFYFSTFIYFVYLYFRYCMRAQLQICQSFNILYIKLSVASTLEVNIKTRD